MDPNEVDRDKVDPKASELYDLTKSVRRLRREPKGKMKAESESPEVRKLRMASERRARRQRRLNESRKKHEREQRKAREAKKKRKRQQRAIEADRDRRARQQRRIKQREAANRLDIKGIASRMRSSAKKSPAKPPAKAPTSSAPVDQTPAVPRVVPRPVAVSTSPEWATDSQAIRLRDLIATRQLLLSPKVRQACGSLSARAFEQWRASMSQVPSGLTAKGAAAWIEELEPLPRTTVEKPPDH